MKRKVLDAVPDSDLRVYVVWLPVLSRLSPEALAGGARSGAKRLADERVQHYLDPKLRLGNEYGRLLELPLDDPAWDAYLVFGPAARWKGTPPRPHFWMHQLGAGPEELRLDGNKLAEVVKRLLAAPGARTGNRSPPARGKARLLGCQPPLPWPIMDFGSVGESRTAGAAGRISSR